MLTEGVRHCCGERPLGRVGEADEDVGSRWARRYGAGDSLAKVAGGKESAEGNVDVAIVCAMSWKRCVCDFVQLA